MGSLQNRKGTKKKLKKKKKRNTTTKSRLPGAGLDLNFSACQSGSAYSRAVPSSPVCVLI